LNDSAIRPRVAARWWGWGDPSVSTELPARAERLLANRGLLPEAGYEIPEISDVALPEARQIPEVVVAAAGDALRNDFESRLRHCGGHSLADLLERRSGEIADAPDAVLVPEGEDRLRAVLEACREASVAVIPWGGGTSVTGGLTNRERGFAAVIALDMERFVQFEVDPVSMTAKLGAGLRGPEAEELLGREGLTLGHFPQSFEFATIGGFAAARSAGQASSGYGRFDEMVTALRLVSPVGDLSTIAGPRASSGPSILEMVLGSEGTLGVITEVTVRVKRAPEVSIYEVSLVKDFQSGFRAVKELAQAGSLPTVMRVSDRAETEISIGMSRPDGVAGTIFDRWLDLRGRTQGSLVVTGYEGSRSEVRAERSATQRALSRAGAVGLGKGAGRSWKEGRFHGPYLREALLDRGLVVDTFETSAVWSGYGEAYSTIRDRTCERLAEVGMSGVVMCHLSHAYPESASLYFTVIATPGPDGPIACWRAVKTAAMDEIAAAGLAVSHHHGVGRDHVEWLEAEVGPSGIGALRGLKEAFDPTGIMNPGCLLPRSESGLRRPR
jgi:alkyldihydroxyacetonephosphate synthase